MREEHSKSAMGYSEDKMNHFCHNSDMSKGRNSKNRGIKYSIIVPAYNSEETIQRTMDSLVKQTYKNIEIVVIDDGSTDNTLSILRDFEEKHNIVKVYHESNQGLMAARANGIRKATGAYCLTVDADDWIEIDTIERINWYLEREAADVVKFRYMREPSKLEGPLYHFGNAVLTSEEQHQLRRDLILTNKYNKLCDEAFRRELYPVYNKESNITFGEDATINLELLGCAKKVLVINDILYHYFENPNSITHAITIDTIGKNILDNMQVNKKCVEYLKIYGIKGIGINEVKKRSLLFACRQIKYYIKTNRNLDFKRLEPIIDETGLQKYIGGKDLTGINRGIDHYICACIMSHKLSSLKLIVPYLRFRFLISKKYRGLYAYKKSVV